MPSQGQTITIDRIETPHPGLFYYQFIYLDRTLIKTLIISVVLILASGLTFPYVAKQSQVTFAEWHVINANLNGQQGDANILIIGDQVVMIDAGPRFSNHQVVLRYLKKFGIDKIDHFIISTPNLDYYGGLVSIIESGIKVEKVYFRMPIPATSVVLLNRSFLLQVLDYARDNKSQLVHINQGYVLDLPNNSRIKVVYAEQDVSVNGGLSIRDMSMILRFDTNESSVLFASNSGNFLAKNIGNTAEVMADFLKMPFPYAEDNPPVSFYDAINPKYVIVPAAKRQWCGEAGEGPREWTFSRQLPTWTTGANGNIHVIWHSDEMVISPQYINDQCNFQTLGNLVIKN